MTESREQSPGEIQRDEFPEELTDRDVKLIRKQCELQNAISREQILGFARAYREAKVLVADRAQLKGLTPERVTDLILEWAVMIESRNTNGIRTTTVRLPRGTIIDPPTPEQMVRFVEFYARGDFTPLEAYVEFEKIHPFEDGNGRLGDLLWKMAVTRETGNWPEELPPDVFGSHSTLAPE